MSLLPASSIGDESTGFYNGVATQSLRTEYGDSNYFYYTPSAGDRMTGSFNMWLKGQNLSDTAYGRYVFQNYGGGSESQFSFIQINNTGNMAFGGYGVNYFASNAFLRDETNYYNLLWTWDTTNGTQNKRQRGYINGVELTSMGSGTRSGVRQELGYGGNFQHNFLANYYPPGGGSDSYITGHTAYTCYVNGLALDPTAFGEDKNGVWIPRNYATKPSLIAQDTGTAIGDLTAQGGLAGAFNGTRFQATSSGAATSGNVSTGYIGKNWGSSKTITGFILYSPTSDGFVGSAGSTFTVKLYGKNGAPSSGTDGTLLFTSSSVNDNLISSNGERGAIKYFADTTITSEETISSFTTDTAFTYHWVLITPNTSTTVNVGQIEFYEDGNTNFGTGGFRLDFNASDLNTSGSSRTDPYGSDTDQPNNSIADASGSGNHLTKTTNIVSTDFTKDSPENNFCVLNALGKQSSGAVSEGNLKAVITGGGNSGRIPGTFAVNSGKWYWEVRQSSSNRFGMGVFDTDRYVMTNEDLGSDAYEWGFITSDNSGSGARRNSNTIVNGYGGETADGHVVMVALDVDNEAIYFGKQGSWFNNGTSDNSATVKGQIEAGTTTNAAYTGVSGRLTPSFVRQTSNNTLHVNFGQDDTFAGNETTAGNTDGNGNGSFQYEPPSGFLALCSDNLPNLTISPAQSSQADDHFNTFLYTGTNATNRNVALNTFTPDWVWLKARSAADNHVVIDSSRESSGTYPNLHPNNTDAEASDSHPKIITNGIQVSGGLYDNNNVNFVVWNWKANGGTTSSNSDGDITSTVQANTTAGFSIVLYTGNGTNNSDVTIGHGLGVKPAMVILKARDNTSSDNWIVWHQNLSPDATYTTDLLFLDSGNGENYYSDQFKSVQDTTFTIRTVDATNGRVNQNTIKYLAYCFAEIEGYSKFGKYIGNNSTDGPFVYTGFRPAFLMLKRSNDSGSFQLLDNKRNTFNSTDIYLFTPGNGSEVDGSGLSTPINIDFLSNGFKVRTQEAVYNSSGGTFVYMAFATQPFKFSNAR